MKRQASEAPAAHQPNSKQRRRDRLKELRKVELTPSQPSTPSTAIDVHVTDFVQAREQEIRGLDAALKNSETGVGKRLFQMLPTHLRRRATSHNVKRLPRLLRQAAIHQDSKLGSAKSTHLRKRARRRTLTALLYRQKNKKWLETHIWHAKRMKMRNQWGYRLALHPTEKNRKRLIKAAQHTTFLHDASYTTLFELRSKNGDLDPLHSHLLPSLMDPTVLACDRTFSGRIERQTWLYTTFPTAPLCPCRVFVPGGGGGSGVVWVWVHPAAADDVEHMLRHRVEATGLDVAVQRVVVNRLELVGARAHALVHRLLDVVGDRTHPAVVDVWRRVRGVSAVELVPRGAVLALTVHDPRLRFPIKMPLRSEDEAVKQEDMDGVMTVLKDWNVPVPSSDLFSAEKRQAVANGRTPLAKLNERRRKRLIPGTPLTPTPADSKVPILLIQNGHGWSLVVPPRWSLAFWHSLVFMGAKVGGLRDYNLLAYEQGLPSYPQDHMDTAAYTEHIQETSTALEQTHLRRPPAKRINYTHLNYPSPFRPDFASLLTAAADRPAWVVRSCNVMRQLLAGTLSAQNAFCMVRVRLVRGRPAHAAQILTHTGGEVIGYVTTGGYALREGRGLGIGCVRVSYVLDLLKREVAREGHRVRVRNPCLPVGSGYDAYLELISEVLDDGC